MRRLLVAVAGRAALGTTIGMAGIEVAREPAAKEARAAHAVPVVVVEHVGGLRVAAPELARPAASYVSSDGVLITIGLQIAVHPPPALANLRRRQLSPAAMSKLRALARAARLDQPPLSYGRPLVVDATTTVVTYRDTRGRTFVHRAYALAPRSFPPGTRAARERLQRFVRALENPTETFGAADVGRNARYVAPAFEIVAGAPPAPRPGAGRQPTKAWPLPSVRLADAVRCTPVTASHAATLRRALSEANELTRWRQGDRSYRVYNRQTMPGEVPCR